MRSPHLINTESNITEMKAVIDEKIPYLGNVLSQLGFDVVSLPGAGIAKRDILDADALFVRTRTLCNRELLGGTPVKFVGTATIGYDHIDTDFCREAGIVWSNAPGCNAGAVLQYVQAVLHTWSRDYGEELAGLTLGIVGVGEIGSRVAAWAESAGMRVLKNDPPREAAGESGFVSLGRIATECDVITFHPTLQKGGDWPSYHLADDAFFESLQRCRLFVNASRGPVVDNAALLCALDDKKLPCAVLDVWENEPELDLGLLNKVYISTPHIAGYSAEGKLNATRIVLERFLDFIGYSGERPSLALPKIEQPVLAKSLPDALLKIYSPLNDSSRLKNCPGDFESLRNNYDLRREPGAYSIVIEQ